MTPLQYVQQFHKLIVHDPLLGIHSTIDVTRYISGMKDSQRKEYEAILSRIATRHLKLKYVKHIPTWFTIPNSDKMVSYEEFSKPGLRRAYGGRASPHELADALRLAVLVDRCKPEKATDYAQTWFGLDCNAFVGNYLGISPSCSISSYVNGYGNSEKISGATNDVYLSRDKVPLPPIARVDDIRAGTVLVTYRPGKKTQWGDHWGHIAVVDTFEGSTAPGKAMIKIVEWGQKGSIGAHVSGAREVNLLHEDLSGTIKKFSGKKIFAFWDKNKEDLRIFLDSTSLNAYAHRGWHIASTWET